MIASAAEGTLQAGREGAGKEGAGALAGRGARRLAFSSSRAISSFRASLDADLSTIALDDSDWIVSSGAWPEADWTEVEEVLLRLKTTFCCGSGAGGGLCVATECLLTAAIFLAAFSYSE